MSKDILFAGDSVITVSKESHHLFLTHTNIIHHRMHINYLWASFGTINDNEINDVRYKKKNVFHYHPLKSILTFNTLCLRSG